MNLFKFWIIQIILKPNFLPLDLESKFFIENYFVIQINKLIDVISLYSICKRSSY